MKTGPQTERYLARKQFFDERAEGWLDMWYKDLETGQYTRFDREFERLFSLVPVPPDGCLLDVGCGSGVLVPYILPRLLQNGRLIELDYAEKMIAVNRRLHADDRITFQAADVMDMDIVQASIDVVLCFSCFPHFEQKPESLKRMGRVLKPGGHLAVAHFDSSEDLNRHHHKHDIVMHDMLPTSDLMREYFAETGLCVDLFLDEPGFYLVLGRKAGWGNPAGADGPVCWS